VKDASVARDGSRIQAVARDAIDAIAQREYVPLVRGDIVPVVSQGIPVFIINAESPGQSRPDR